MSEYLSLYFIKEVISKREIEPEHFLGNKVHYCWNLTLSLVTLVAKNFGCLIFGHIFSHFGQILDKDFGHFAETLLKQI